MEVTVHSVTDQACSWHGNRNFGLNEEGYEKAMDWINKHQEYRGGERYEYFGVDMEIKFIWDMTELEFKTVHDATPDDYEDDMTEYEGALFFGNFKLEFIKSRIAGCYCNLFQYGAEDTPNGAYEYLEDGTPYEERYPISDEIRIPHRRTFESFAGNVEKQVIDLLNRHPEFIEDALKPTVPSNWYLGARHNYIKNFTRIA